MSSQQDLYIINLLSSISSKLNLYFSYIAPWICLGLSTFAFTVLVLRKRREKNLIIYLFAWQYAFAIFFALNLVFNDPQFSLKLFNYTLKQYVSDPVCKLSNMILRFFYFTSPWMQVVIIIYFEMFLFYLLYVYLYEKCLFL